MTAREQGFTIFEALVAFAILASVISALYAVSATSLRLIGESDRTEQAAMLAQSKLDELASIRSPLPAVETGTFAGGDVAWRVEARDLPSSKAGPTAFHLQAVKLILSWPGSRPLVVETRHLGTSRHG
jgi:Tfp pilus assembly protein PilV